MLKRENRLDRVPARDWRAERCAELGVCVLGCGVWGVGWSLSAYSAS